MPPMSMPAASTCRPPGEQRRLQAFPQQRASAAKPMSPRQICFELTETSAVRDLARAQRFIQTVRGLGCRFARMTLGNRL